MSTCNGITRFHMDMHRTNNFSLTLVKINMPLLRQVTLNKLTTHNILNLLNPNPSNNKLLTFPNIKHPSPIILNNKLLTFIFLNYKLLPLIFTKIKPLTPTIHTHHATKLRFLLLPT